MNPKNDKVRKKLDRILTVVTVLSVLVCFILCIQVISGKNASLFGFRIYHILTGSMEPTIATNSKVIVKQVDPETLEKGDIITFVSKDAAIYGNANTHRIIDIFEDEAGNKCFATKGDANNAVDGVLVYPQDVIGKVVFHMNSSVSLFLGFLHTKLGFVTVILLPFMLIIWLLLKDFKSDVSEYIDAAANRKAIAELQIKLDAIEAEKARMAVEAENAENISETKTEVVNSEDNKQEA